MSHKKISKHSAIFYLVSFLIPIGIYGAIILSYQFGLGKMYVNSFSSLRIPMLGIASVAFAYYLRHTHMFRLSGKLPQLAMSVSYGLSSYILAQENNVLILLAYSLFPVLFLTYEWMISDEKHIPFIIGNAILLLVCPIVGIPVTILLYLLSFFDLSLKKRLHFGDFLHTTGNFLLSILTGSFGIIYYLAPYYADHETYAYEGFQATNDFTIFLSRFLPGSVPSQQFFFQYNKIDLYFGIFAMTLAVLFFFQRSITSRKRLYYAIFTLILVAGTNLSPLQYVLNSFLTSDQYTIAYSFLIIFWLLRLASESYTVLSRTTKLPVCITTFVLLIILGVSWYFGKQNFLPWMSIAHIMFWGLSALLLLYAVHTQQARRIRICLFYLVLAELCFNIAIITNNNFKPKSISTNAKPFYQNYSTKNDTTTLSEDNNKQDSNQKHIAESNQIQTDNDSLNDPMFSITVQEYNSYVSNHTNKKTNEILQNLKGLNLLDEYTYPEYSDQILPNDFEQFNAICHKLGIQENLFTPYDVSIVFPENPVYQIIDLGNHIYHISCPAEKGITSGFIPYTIKANNQSQSQNPIYLIDNASGMNIELNEQILSGRQPAYLPITSETSLISVNYQILCYSMNPDVLEQLPPLIDQTVKELQQNKPSYIKYDIFGIICSYIGLMILLILLLINNKEQVYQRLYKIRKTLTNALWIQKISLHFRQNKVYYLAFLLPALLILCIYIYTDCMPFGSNTIFDEDGIALVLPEYLDYRNNFLDGNTYLTMHAGYANNVYNNAPYLELFKFYKYLSTTQMIILQHIILMFGIGFSGVTMVFYMTHRQKRPISKKNMLLLLPAIIYATNAYMLRCHSFNTWYYIYLILPILLISFQHMLNQKKWFAYTALLGICIILNIQLALYICIFLVIQFFCYRFENIRDFFRKGIRFAWTSILSAGCGFYVIATILTVSKQLNYQEEDATLPSLAFHGNFLAEWKNYMIYSPVKFVSTNDGDLFAYCGIVTLFFVLVYFISKQFTWQEKLRKFIPIILLSVSFNNQMLSYIWNGLHYQSNVPNRYTFILIILLAEIAYDGITVVCSLSRRSFSYITVGIILFFLCCQSYTDSNTALAFTSSMILCLLYLALHFWYKKSNQKHYYTTILLVFAIIELTSNGLYTSNEWIVSSINRYNDFENQNLITTTAPMKGKDFYRNIYPGNFFYNGGKIYHNNSNAVFGSYVSKYQTQLNQSYGFQNGSNYTSSNYCSNQMGLALSSTRYIYLESYNTSPIQDLTQYQYVGFYNNYYIFENPYYLSLGFWVPESALHYNEQYENVLYELPPHYYNFLAKEYITKDQNLNAIHPIYWSESTTEEDSYYFTDENNNILSIDDTIKRYLDLDRLENYRLKLHINFTVPCDGYLYLFMQEMDGLGYVHKGEKYHTVIDIPNLNNALSDMFYMTVLKEDVFQEFYENASKNQLENITIKNDTITGTTNYAQDGYTMLSIPYDKGWTAYIDGQKVAIENPYDTGLYIKTPSGRHTLTLKFVPYNMKLHRYISLGFWIFTLMLYGINKYSKHRKK